MHLCAAHQFLWLQSMKITFVGTGHVGLVIGAHLQDLGNHSVCVGPAIQPDQDARAAIDAERTRQESGWVLSEPFRACYAASVRRDLENRDWRTSAQEDRSGKSGPATANRS